MLMPASPLRGAPPPAASRTPSGGGVRPIGAHAPDPRKPRHAARARPWLALLLAGAALLGACRATPPEQALRDTIARMQAAAEARDADALFDPIAEDFAGAQGMDRQDFRRYVTVMNLRNARVSASLGPIEVKLYGERATADFTAALSGGAGFLPERAQVYDVSTGWRLVDGEWQLISARWTPKL